MKKILLIAAVIAMAIPLAAGVSFGAKLIAATANSGFIHYAASPSCSISLSKNVSFVYSPDSTAGEAAQSYAIGSRHNSGNKVYGTSSDTTLIYWQAKTTGDVTATEIDDSDSDVFDSSWTAM
jgi:hypothetical protein